MRHFEPVVIRDLMRGDIVRGKASGLTYTVDGTYGTRATAVRSADITNADEWEVMRVDTSKPEPR